MARLDRLAVLRCVTSDSTSAGNDPLPAPDARRPPRLWTCAVARPTARPAGVLQFPAKPSSSTVSSVRIRHFAPAVRDQRPRAAVPGRVDGECAEPPSRAPGSSPFAIERPEPARASSAKASNDLDLALYYHRAGDFENALQHYRALLQKNELDAQAHNNLGLLYQEKNLLQESARELQRATLRTRNAGAHNNYGSRCSCRAGRMRGAGFDRAGVAPATSRRSSTGAGPRTAAQSLRQGDILSALHARRMAGHYNLAQLYDQTNEPARAVEHYRRFLETAAAEHAGRVAAVRARIAALSRTPE